MKRIQLASHLSIVEVKTTVLCPGISSFEKDNGIPESDWSERNYGVIILITKTTETDLNLLHTDDSCILTGRKTKIIKKSLSLAFSSFQPAVYMCLYQHHDVYERSVFVRSSLNTCWSMQQERENSFSFCCLQIEDSGVQEVNIHHRTETNT